MKGLYFDGRKDKTVTQVLGDDRKYHKQIISEEHITMVAEPNGTYFNHKTPNSDSSKDIIDSIVTSLKERNVNTEKIQAVGCDRTNVNTGQNAGVIRRLEESFNHPLQWLVCFPLMNCSYGICLKLLMDQPPVHVVSLDLLEGS